MDAKTEISAVPTEFLIKSAKEVLSTFAMSDKDCVSVIDRKNDKENHDRTYGAYVDDGQRLICAGYIQDCRRRTDGTTEQWNPDASIRTGDISPALRFGMRAIMSNSLESRLPPYRHGACL